MERISATVLDDSAGALAPEVALRPDLAGMRIFGAPLFGVARADDPLFEALRREEAVGPWHMLPGDVCPGAKSVLSVFLPYIERIKASNAGGAEPSAEWLHGRIEGHKFMVRAAGAAVEALRAAGHRAALPMADGRFFAQEGATTDPAAFPGVPEAARGAYTSNWSERHVAYVCGLGTFGLSKGLITEKGACGRFFSLVTDLEMAPTPRAYGGIYDHCIRCGRCAARCPAGAIDTESGKAHPPCGAKLVETRGKYAPRYGCGKCLCGVPCEGRDPSRE
ncbi:MAG: 4Fe-4S binding protein [Clostridiales Family XIII bacterium]|nr:4Fe-4S binding protein [Clostridiales Family XIII bacterium]